MSDERKKRIYDQHGEEGVKAHEEGQDIDFKELFKSLFGAGKFDDIFDDIFYIHAVLDNAPEEMTREQLDAAINNELMKECKRFSIKLNEKIKPFVEQNVEVFKANIIRDIEDKIDAPGGPELLSLIGYVYINEAEKHRSRFLGLGKFGASIKENAKWIRASAQTYGDAFGFQAAANELEMDPTNEKAQEAFYDKGLSVMWRLGKLEIEKLVRGTCKMSIKDTTQPKSVRKERLKAIKQLGKMYKDAGASHLQKRRLDELKTM